MSVSHAQDSHDTHDEVPGLLEVLAQIPDPRRRRGRRFGLVFVLAVAVVAVLSGATNFREIGDHARDLPAGLLERLGGRRHPLKRVIAVPSEKRIRTLIQQLDAALLDRLIGGWLQELNRAGRLEPLLAALAIDGKHLRGTHGVVLFAAMLHDTGVVVAQRQVPAGTTETTQVGELLDPLDLNGVVVTADAAHTQAGTARHIAGDGDGDRGADYFLTVKANQPALQKAIFHKIQADRTADPDHRAVQKGHGRIVERQLWVTDAQGIDFPCAGQVARIRRDVYDLDGQRLSKQVVHAVTSLDADHATPADLAALARGQWGLESIHWIRDAVYREDDNKGYTGAGPQVMATLRNLAVSLLHLNGITRIKATLQDIGRDPDRVLAVLPL